MNTTIDNQQNGSDIFWGEIAPCEHLVQIYKDHDVFLDALEGFVGGGIRAGDGVIVIATPSHLTALEDRLDRAGFDVAAVRAAEQFIPLNAEETLAKFMVGGWPDEELFREVVVELLTRARMNGRRVRAFGEMVAILWGRGHNGATVKLEHLWHRFCQTEAFCLFCAYPRIGFTQDADASAREICAAHSKVVAG